MYEVSRLMMQSNMLVRDLSRYLIFPRASPVTLNDNVHPNMHKDIWIRIGATVCHYQIYKCECVVLGGSEYSDKSLFIKSNAFNVNERKVR